MLTLYLTTPFCPADVFVFVLFFENRNIWNIELTLLFLLITNLNSPHWHLRYLRVA